MASPYPRQAPAAGTAEASAGSATEPAERATSPSLGRENSEQPVSNTTRRTLSRHSKTGILGVEEFSRYLPSGRVNIVLITWNMGGNKPPSDLNDLLLPERMKFVPDMYVIALQEANKACLEELEIGMQTTIGPSHVLLHSLIHGVLCLSVFVRRDLVWFFSAPEQEVYNWRPAVANMVKTKGAIGISFRLFGTSFLFIGSHLPAHADNNADRKECYDNVCSDLDLPQNLKPLKTKYLSKDVTARFDACFWMGDMNFRIEMPYEEVVATLARITGEERWTAKPYELLLKKDQLRRGMKQGSLFKGFQEVGPIAFPPTFKFTEGSDQYDREAGRTPSWTDRILIRTKEKGSFNCSGYDCLTSIRSSDHRPVMAWVDCKVKAGRDDVKLNGGLFDRDVFMQGLERRARELIDGRTKDDNCALS